ncbi:hypothetical protein B0H14DRAFT_2283898, partial [Mycena olivaceomarginata]
MLNAFNNDKDHVSVQWLSTLVTKRGQRGLTVRHLLLVKHKSMGTVHYVAVLSDARCVCDCCMPANLGTPYRHFFGIWVDVRNIPFHISLI